MVSMSWNIVTISMLWPPFCKSKMAAIHSILRYCFDIQRYWKHTMRLWNHAVTASNSWNRVEIPILWPPFWKSKMAAKKCSKKMGTSNFGIYRLRPFQKYIVFKLCKMRLQNYIANQKCIFLGAILKIQDGGNFFLQNW